MIKDGDFYPHLWAIAVWVKKYRQKAINRYGLEQVKQWELELAEWKAISDII